MPKLLRTLLFFSCVFLLGVWIVSANEVSDVVQEANALLATKEVPNIERAIEVLEESLYETGDDGDVLWSLAKAYLYLGDRSEDNKLKIYEQGKEYADQAITVAPDNPHAHYWLGTLIGRIGQTKGILNSLFMIKPLQEAMERVLEIDEEYADAYYVLSRLYDEAPGWPISIGNRNKALEMIEIALELDPDNPEFKVQIAKVLLSYRRKDEALEILMEAYESPEMEIDEILRADADELLAKLK
ncbi:MAG: hypothetical protein GX020_06290 [Firmicutes bacterium]|nr:hypothetical protein [Bacillota bacterium]